MRNCNVASETKACSTGNSFGYDFPKRPFWKPIFSLLNGTRKIARIRTSITRTRPIILTKLLEKLELGFSILGPTRTRGFCTRLHHYQEPQGIVSQATGSWRKEVFVTPEAGHATVDHPTHARLSARHCHQHCPSNWEGACTAHSVSQSPVCRILIQDIKQDVRRQRSNSSMYQSSVNSRSSNVMKTSEKKIFQRSNQPER